MLALLVYISIAMWNVYFGKKKVNMYGVYILYLFLKTWYVKLGTNESDDIYDHCKNSIKTLNYLAKKRKRKKDQLLELLSWLDLNLLGF